MRKSKEVPLEITKQQEIKRLANEPGCNKAEIARKFGITRAHVQRLATKDFTHSDGAVPDVTDSRVIRLEADLAHAKQELLEAKRSAKAAIKDNGLFAAIVDEMDKRVFPLPPLPSQCIKRPGRKINETLVLHLSDMHADEIVTKEETGDLEEFNFEIACRRAEVLIDTTLDFTQNVLSNYQFDNLVVLSYGDHTSGEIHGAVSRSHYRNQFNNSLAIGQLQARMIGDLAPHFKQVDVLSVAGNHGRTTEKKDHHGAQKNWDYLITKIAQLHLQKHKNVSFTIPNAFSANIEIAGHVFNVSHGDDIKGSLGVPFYGMMRRQGNLMKLASMSGSPQVRYSVMGHHHVAASLQDLNGELMVNGAWVGTNAYSYNSFSGYREPCQWLHGVSETHGITWRLNVNLKRPGLEVPKRYKINLDGGLE
jgi:hypothetical protein